MHKITASDLPNAVRIESLLNHNLFAELTFLLQPIVIPTTGEVVAFEALSKVISQSGDQLNNEDFFEHAGTELLKSLVIAQISAFKRTVYTKRRILISYNLPLSCMEDDCFVEKLLAICTQKIALEFTDLNVNLKSKKIADNLAKVQHQGHQLWLDDYLHHSRVANLTLGYIEWDIIKIDKSYLYFNTEEESLLKSLTSVLQSYVKKGVIFEGVETELQRRLICREKTFAQGYYFSYPRCINEVIQKMKFTPWKALHNERSQQIEHTGEAPLPV
ncbi:EAL domain-containing protein [Photobacterium sanguinicancri]|uniref:EAL domain-containing protein n=1 Tax=Photobacterium sanguinicancri TaxID=875932 RepID=UPI003D14C476